VGLRACAEDGGVPACACLAFPVPADEDPAKHEYFAQIKHPVLFVTGTVDEISCLGTIRRIIERNGAAEHCTVQALPGVDHFYGDLTDLVAAVGLIHAFLKDRLSAPVEAE